MFTYISKVLSFQHDSPNLVRLRLCSLASLIKMEALTAKIYYNSIRVFRRQAAILSICSNDRSHFLKWRTSDKYNRARGTYGDTS